MAAKLLAGRLVAYTLESWRHSRQPETRQDFGGMMRLFPSWLRSLRSSPVADRQPWMTYGAIDFLRRQARPELSVFEWGCGGSTLFLSGRVKRLSTVEHEPAWAEDVQKAMSGQHGTAWDLRVIEAEVASLKVSADPADPAAYRSAVGPWQCSSFKRYATSIDVHGDGLFDWVLVDGRSRPACVMHGIPKVRAGGLLLLDDAARPRYDWVHQEMGRLGWERFSFAGPVPYTFDFGSTTAWRRPLES